MSNPVPPPQGARNSKKTWGTKLKCVALIRVLSIAERLKMRRATLDELAAEHGVTTRTIRRDLEAMSLAGLRVRNTADAHADGINGFWWMERDR